MKKIIGVILGLLLALNLSASTAFAAEFLIAKDEGNITVSETEKVKNLYTGGNIVTISADVQKSLYVGGNMVTIDGDVEDNLFIGGSNVMIRGDVGGSIHAGGGTVTIQGNITDDLLVGGGTVTISESASIGGDLIVGGGLVIIDGPVEGDVLIGGGQVTINSSIGGSVKAESESLELGEKAVITGDITYKATEEMVAADEAIILGEVEYSEVSETKVSTVNENVKVSGFLPKLISFGLFVKLLISFATALVIVLLFGKKVQTFVQEAFANFWTNMGIGFAILVSAPIVCILLLITVLGGGLAGLAGTIYILMLSFALPLGSIAFGSWIIKTASKQSKYVADWKAAIVGVLAISLLSWIPMIGWLAKFIFMLIGLGTFYRLSYKGLVAKKIKK